MLPPFPRQNGRRATRRSTVASISSNHEGQQSPEVSINVPYFNSFSIYYSPIHVNFNTGEWSESRSRQCAVCSSLLLESRVSEEMRNSPLNEGGLRDSTMS